jgi:hypothetical protein
MRAPNASNPRDPAAGGLMSTVGIGAAISIRDIGIATRAPCGGAGGYLKALITASKFTLSD